MDNNSSLRKKLESFQQKIMEHNLAEAELKAEKARVELETAKLTQQHVQNLLLSNSGQGGVLQ